MGGFFFWVAIGLLALYAGIRARLRIRRNRDIVTDDDIRQILEDGVVWVEDEEPLDMEEIEQEEQKFWGEEDWDSAEEL